MGLWIVPQNKKELLKTERILIAERKILDDEIQEIVYHLYDVKTQVLLGEYKTETKALAVLEEIKTALREAKLNIIYEMPQK